MSGKTSSTSTWLKFFRGAGIPTGIDTKYALLFDENRIKMDMLMDLDKEILKDVGIVAMGDIISILKHARKVHDETKEQAVETNKPTQSQSQSPIPSGVSGKAALESSVQSAVKVVSKVCIPVSNKPESKSTPGEVTVKAKSASLLQQSIRMMERATQGKSLPTETVRKAVTQPAEIAERKMIVLNKRSNAESPLREEVPLQKKIRVLPEHEGKYKIKMPDGLIPRTQKVIQSRLGPSVSELASTKDKKNVFERLGESSVSSSTEDKQPLSSSTSSSSTRIESSNDNFSKLSVFERLGDRGRQAGGSPKTPITLSSTVTKPLIQTKIYLPPHQTAAQPPKSRYDPKVYTEKTLTTIPSRISIPYLNKARVKSEIIAPSASSSTTTTRVISAKTSATSTTSQSQTKIMVGLEKEVIPQQRLEQRGTDETREVNIALTKQKPRGESSQPTMGTPRIKSQIVALPPKSYCKVDLASKLYNSEKDVPVERKISENYKSDVLQREAFRSDIGPASNVKVLSTVFKAKERNEYERSSPDQAQRRNDVRDERRYWERTGEQINDECHHEKRQILKYKSDVKEEKGLQTESTKSKILISSKSKQNLKEDSNVRLDLSHSTCRQNSSSKRKNIVYSSNSAEKMVRRSRGAEEKHESRKRKNSCSDSSTEDYDAANKTTRINPKLSCEREEQFYRNKESRSDGKPYDSECLTKISRTNPKLEQISENCKKENACANASHTKRDGNSVKKISRTNPKFEKTFKNQSKGILCGTTSLLKREDGVGKISRTNPELEKQSAKVHDRHKRDIPSTVTSSSHAKLDDTFMKKICQNSSESGKTTAKDFEILKEIPGTRSSQPSSQKLICEQLVIYEDRSIVNVSQRQQTSNDSNIEQVVKYENKLNACGKCSLETCGTESLKGHTCDKYFKQTYVIINDKYGAEAAAPMKPSVRSSGNVHYNNIVDLVSKEDMSICLNIANDKYQVGKAEDDNSENALIYSEYKRSYEEFNHDQADHPVKSKERINLSYDPPNSQCSKSQPMFMEKEAHPKNYTQRKDQNKKQYNENRAAFDYSNTFVRENNIVQYNFSGEEIIRIARPPSDNDGYVPDDKSMKMMAKMGWSPGRGLGKHNQGRKSVIENGKVRLNNLGLGFGRK